MIQTKFFIPGFQKQMNIYTKPRPEAETALYTIVEKDSPC